MHIHRVFGFFNKNEIWYLLVVSCFLKKVNNFHVSIFINFHFKRYPVQIQISLVDPKCSLKLVCSKPESNPG